MKEPHLAHSKSVHVHVHVSENGAIVYIGGLGHKWCMVKYLLAVHRHSTGSLINVIMTRYAGITLSMLHSNCIILHVHVCNSKMDV